MRFHTYTSLKIFCKAIVEIPPGVVIIIKRRFIMNVYPDLLPY